MSLTDTLQNTLSGLMNTTLNRYQLDIPSCTSPLDVEDFCGTETLSQLYRYDISFTSTDRNVEASQLLSKPATLTMGGGILQSLTEHKRVHGVVTHFERISSSADQTEYMITLEPFLSLLDKQFRTHRFFVDKSVPEVVEQVLQEHGLHGWEYEFNLKQSYPKREQINQYQESDLVFIRRLLAEVGIFYFFSLQEDAQSEVVHFADAQSALMFGKTLPVNSPSGMSDSGADSVWGLNVTHNVVEASVTARDYNHRDAQSVLQSAPADMTRGDGEGVTYGDVYHYQLRHLARGDKIDPTAETANFYARLDHERFLANRTLITGSSTAAWLAPAQVLTLTDGLPPSLPAPLQEPVLITGTGFTASRREALRVTLLAVPYSETVCWRPPLLPRPKVTGTMTARVTSAKANDIYAWQDASGLYRVKFDADRDGKSLGQESMPVRLAKPYGGDVYGFHFPLIQGTEVAIAFHEGDPDRPYIAHALHDSRHVDHVTEKNSTRNVIRTPTNNKLRMEDKRGEEHIKLSTEYGGKTQLNLGHNVDDDRLLRGEGAELRTDDWVSIRGGKGVFISADAQQAAQGRMMDMEEAIQQLKNALSLAKSLSKIVQKAEATRGDLGSQEELNNALEDLKQAGILAHAPNGIGIVSPKSVRMASGGASVGLMSDKNTDISAGESITLAAVKKVSVFSQSEGMQLFAGRGKMDIQAQNDALNLQAQKDITISSSEGKVTVSASQELLLTCGGAYIKLSGGNIELGAPGNIFLKAANVQKMGANSVSTPPKEFPKGYSGGFTLREPESGEIQPFTFFKITTGEGEIYEGVSDEKGKTMPIFTAMPSALKIEFPDEKKVTALHWTYGENEVPVSGLSRHYTDLNLHAETENYQPGEFVDINIDKGDGIIKSYQIQVKADGVAVAKNIFKDEMINFDEEV
ncbi:MULTISPECIES: type VI secretion system Vgr family protein [Citrobacter]|uniref:type VI secretion system Vgr family protein n=1 Tax=Citrobacter TaxID=544 RepID=UPI0015E910B7|nr:MULTISPECIES: type VI secretion system Vgr family protein [Citrobacter]EHG7581553.1 type VI secretion system tip protein VgrG [Citrobacter sedlakii]EIQ7156972.1 type VI secretion system tip protein VgrG [Citrobacter sedlakii]MBN6599963.1 type VI secretion system tip protein VgrG [Citrobacter sedlakii]QMK45486.1 type VI secretion system tip protein VgrG [Citrobacter sp. RHB21-C05]QMK63930.1 type VI secretion system tip protein VgrG [Citrobacter sp. RHB21-C01]